MAKTQNISKIKFNSIEEGCRELADILGLDEPVAPAVLISAVQSEEYARNLLTCRETPTFLQTLLNNPVQTNVPQTDSKKGSLELLKGVSKSLIRWSKVGFSIAKDEVIEKRLNACLKCPEIRQTENKSVVYEILETKATCGLCGCDIEKKARMSSEYCPGEDPDNAGYNRWGQ